VFGTQGPEVRILSLRPIISMTYMEKSDAIHSAPWFRGTGNGSKVESKTVL
jgi:hypothetical protein